MKIFSDSGTDTGGQFIIILAVKMDAFSSPIFFQFPLATASWKQARGGRTAVIEEPRYGTYHIRVEMRRPTPTQSMNTTQRRSFIILKNPMSSTKPNPTVDTEKKIYEIHSGTLLGSWGTGHSPYPPEAHSPVGKTDIQTKPMSCVLCS